MKHAGRDLRDTGRTERDVSRRQIAGLVADQAPLAVPELTELAIPPASRRAGVEHACMMRHRPDRQLLGPGLTGSVATIVVVTVAVVAAFGGRVNLAVAAADRPASHAGIGGAVIAVVAQLVVGPHEAVAAGRHLAADAGVAGDRVAVIACLAVRAEDAVTADRELAVDTAVVVALITIVTLLGPGRQDAVAADRPAHPVAAADALAERRGHGVAIVVSAARLPAQPVARETPGDRAAQQPRQPSQGDRSPGRSSG